MISVLQRAAWERNSTSIIDMVGPLRKKHHEKGINTNLIIIVQSSHVETPHATKHCVII